MVDIEVSVVAPGEPLTWVLPSAVIRLDKTRRRRTKLSGHNGWPIHVPNYKIIDMAIIRND